MPPLSACSAEGCEEPSPFVSAADRCCHAQGMLVYVYVADARRSRAERCEEHASAEDAGRFFIPSFSREDSGPTSPLQSATSGPVGLLRTQCSGGPSRASRSQPRAPGGPDRRGLHSKVFTREPSQQSFHERAGHAHGRNRLATRTPTALHTRPLGAGPRCGGYVW